MWKPIFEIARTTALVMTITADEKAGLLTVTVNPKPASKDAPPALSQPLILTATPEELDEGFVESMTTYGSAYASLKETVEAAVAVMEATKKDSAGKAVAKQAARRTPMPMAGAKASPATGEESDDDESPTGEAGQEEGGAAPAPADTQTINLFA